MQGATLCKATPFFELGKFSVAANARIRYLTTVTVTTTVIAAFFEAFYVKLAIFFVYKSGESFIFELNKATLRQIN